MAELALALAEFGSTSAKLSVERILGTQRRAGIVVTAPLAPSADPRAAMAPGSSAYQRGPATISYAETQLGPATAANWDQRTGSASVASKGRPLIWIGVAGALIAIGIPVAGLLKRAPPQPVAPTATTTAPATSATAPATPQGATTAALLPPAESLAPATPESAAVPPPAPADAASPAAVAPHPANPRPKPPSAPSAKPGPGPNCRPPYVIDAAGHRQYKPECL